MNLGLKPPCTRCCCACNRVIRNACRSIARAIQFTTSEAGPTIQFTAAHAGYKKRRLLPRLSVAGLVQAGPILNRQNRYSTRQIRSTAHRPKRELFGASRKGPKVTCLPIDYRPFFALVLFRLTPPRRHLTGVRMLAKPSWR